MGRSVLFAAVDFVEHHDTFRRGMVVVKGTPARVVVEFPTDTPYMLLDRKMVRFVTQLQALRYEKAQGEALHALMGDGNGEPPPHAHVSVSPADGVKIGQYL